jgi:hypothetical protein
MYAYQSIKELLNVLNLGKELLNEMFGKRKSFNYSYDQAIELIEENRLIALIEKGIIVKNGRYIEIEDQLLTFFEQILDVNEEINTSYINEHITVLKENIDYYLTENNESRKYKYLKSIKTSLRKMGFIVLRNIVDLNRNIDNTFKTEPNYKIKVKKLESYDNRRVDIKKLIILTERLVTEDEILFFSQAKDDELNRITTELRNSLQDARHNIIETERQIIDFLNQVKHQSEIIEKLRQVKYLKDQFELESKTDIKEQLIKANPIIFENKSTFPIKLSLDILQEDETYAVIQLLNKKNKTKVKQKVQIAKTINSSFFDDTVEENIFFNIEEMKNNFMASGYNLLDFVLQYKYQREVSFEEIVTCYCELIAVYENDLHFTDEFTTHRGTEFSVVYPK